MKMTAVPLNENECWAQVVQRDRGADGRFVYAVRTTGIYCRPSCPSRRPLRANVAFFSEATLAERAGFRPCRRCRPNEHGDTDRRTALITEACRHIEDAQEPPSLDDLAAAAGLSRFHFHRLFKAVAGVTPKAYAAAARARRIRERLAGTGTITEAIYDAGFNSSGRFYAEAPGRLGMTPTAFRRGGAHEEIRFAVGQCWLGAVLVAATVRGICAILLGDDPAKLVMDLEDRFPHAGLVGGDAAFEQWVASVVGLVEDPGQGLDLPLDVRGTAFQQKVWQALRAIPPGETATYAEIARRIGMPRAVRAVAGACAANPAAVAIPCHRVVRTDGGLSGYRWGVERKRALQKREKKNV
ncbi:bifunctional DNA-binding transcriptional regulator/O6-methylguanine-DNA methyltransferase Ada [Magnetospirillum aberrantis SpK]|uniref:methylated-DNA--[protein]-cysteine S-methyltransferase n=2 Tax=Magnetospirillum TaxID=13134 RepID=A0A7C9QT31_9PROT|nr:bifunctional DNA-binding transcriptional regulator/O6-methylguanine-DNA methyltransferase Ada [Magnetospirillum aberrantis]NFV79844.1 bifunctional DNA-binding transcriptional regulator/O6-methylguanine-DNA methyltransferase Ada [Magnetospirillum aberrantis SpK]